MFFYIWLFAHTTLSMYIEKWFVFIVVRNKFCENKCFLLRVKIVCLILKYTNSRSVSIGLVEKKIKVIWKIGKRNKKEEKLEKKKKKDMRVSS